MSDEEEWPYKAYFIQQSSKSIKKLHAEVHDNETTMPAIPNWDTLSKQDKGV